MATPNGLVNKGAPLRELVVLFNFNTVKSVNYLTLFIGRNGGQILCDPLHKMRRQVLCLLCALSIWLNQKMIYKITRRRKIISVETTGRILTDFIRSRAKL